MPNPLAYAQWANLTREHQLLDAQTIINAAQRYQTWMLGEMLTVNASRLLRQSGGKYFTERLKLQNTGDFHFYSPGTPRTITRITTNRTAQYPWRTAENAVAWTDFELMTTQGKSDLDIFKNFRKSLRQDGASEHWDGMETAIWTPPDQATMEVLNVDPGVAYSIPAFVTENVNGTGPYRAPGWGTGTLAGIDPDDEVNWRNKVVRYTDADIGHAHTGIFAAFDSMARQVMYRQPPGGFAKYFDDMNLRSRKIATNGDGSDKYAQLLREGNDQFRAGPQDPAYGMPVFKGIPVYYAAALDVALLQETTGVYANTAYTTGKPRYFWLDLETLHPVYHADRFMYETEIQRGSIDQYDTFAQFYVSWFNIVCVDRRRQGIVCPLSDA